MQVITVNLDNSRANCHLADIRYKGQNSRTPANLL